MTTNYTLPDGRDISQVFESGDAGLSTGYATSNGADLGRQFVAGSSGVVTGYKNPAGIDLGSVFGVRSAWTNPHISSNGTLGGNTFSVKGTGDGGGNWSGSPAGKAFDGNNASAYFDRCGSKATEDYLTLTMYSPIPVKLTRITVTPDYYGYGSAILQYSENGSSFTDLASISGSSKITISSPGYYKYWKLRRLAYGNNKNGWRNVNISEIKLEGYAIT